MLVGDGSSSLYIVMPAYNEAESLPCVLDAWYPLVCDHPDSRLLVVNDGSTDETAAVLDEYALSHERLAIENKSNGGHGSAIYRGYELAVQGAGSSALPDFVFQTDSDGQTSVSDFAEFWNRRLDYDALLGVRRNREDGAARAIVSTGLRAVVRATMGVRVADANVPYRLISRTALARCLEMIPEAHTLTNVMLSAALVKSGARIGYMPIQFGAREHGKNSVNAMSAVRMGLNCISDFRRVSKQFDEAWK